MGIEPIVSMRMLPIDTENGYGTHCVYEDVRIDTEPWVHPHPFSAIAFASNLYGKLTLE